MLKCTMYKVVLRGYHMDISVPISSAASTQILPKIGISYVNISTVLKLNYCRWSIFTPIGEANEVKERGGGEVFQIRLPLMWRHTLPNTPTPRSLGSQVQAFYGWSLKLSNHWAWLVLRLVTILTGAIAKSVWSVTMPSSAMFCCH